MTPHNFGIEFQKQLVKMMLTDVSFLIKCLGYLEEDFFAAGPMRWTFNATKTHYQSYGKIPDTLVFATELTKTVPADEQTLYVEFIRSVLAFEVTDAEYIKDNLQTFVKKNVFVRGYSDCATLWNAHKVDEALELMTKTMHQINTTTFTPPDRTFFFEDFKTRQLQRVMEASDDSIMKSFPTGILMLDEVFGPAGGLSRGEVGLIVGDTKAGKSIALNHMAFACARIGGKVLIVTLEGSRRLTENRMDARFAEERYQNIKFGNYSSEEVEQKVYREYEMLKGNMVIRGFTDKWDYNIIDVEQEIDDVRAMGFDPDMLVIDYLDLLYPREFDAKENLYARQTRVAQDIHSIAAKRNLAVWTATQATRPTTKSNDPHFVLRANNMADCYGKARTVELVLTLNFTDKERARGVMRLFIDRYRDNQAGQIIPIQTDFTKMIFSDPKMLSSSIVTDADQSRGGNYTKTQGWTP